MRRCNPKRVFPIYTCGRHGNSNIPAATKTLTHLGFTASAVAPLRLLHPVHRRTSSRSSTCIYDWESRSPEPSSLAILHWEMVNKVFGKRSSRLLARFVKFFTMACIPLRWSHAESHRLQRELRQADHRLHPVVIIKEP
jgi:hypothetical protein